MRRKLLLLGAVAGVRGLVPAPRPRTRRIARYVFDNDEVAAARDDVEAAAARLRDAERRLAEAGGRAGRVGRRAGYPSSPPSPTRKLERLLIIVFYI